MLPTKVMPCTQDIIIGLRSQEPTLFYTFKSLDKRIVRKLKENTLKLFCLISKFGLIWLGNFDVPAKTDLNIKFRCKYDYI